MLKTPSFLAAILLLTAVLSADLAANQRVTPSDRRPSDVAVTRQLDPLEPPTSGGLEVLDRSLARLSCHRRLLVVGAHPDDEDNALLAYVSHGLGGEVAYLSLSRGEGGQNLIGPELGTDLGVIRTGELLAARALEDGRQYFSRAYDFGYTRSLAETFSRWPREILQRDAIRAGRRFKPQVVVAVFPESARAGHGQHQASAVIARDLFELSGDAKAYPELAQEGLDPWSPRALYRRAWGRLESTLSYELGALQPTTGRSLGQLAAASRSLHRSQDMGRLQRIGTVRGGLAWVAGGAGGASTDAFGDGIFSGVDTRLAAMAASVSDSEMRGRLESVLEAVEIKAREIRETLTLVQVGAAVDEIAHIVKLLDEAMAIASGSGSRAAVELVAEKRGLAAAALIAAAELVLDARVNREEIVAGSSATVEADLWVAGKTPVVVRAVRLESGADWVVDEMNEIADDDSEAGVRRWRGRIEVPIEAQASAPYFLARPRLDDLYDWQATPVAVRGEPFEPPPVTVVFALELAGVTIEVDREAVYRFADQAVGEVRRPVRAVPPVEVRLESDLHLWRRGADSEAGLEVVVRSNLERPVAGKLVVEAPEGWKIEGDLEFRVDREKGTIGRSLRLIPMTTPDAGRYGIEVRAEFEGRRYADSFPIVEYPHIRPRVAPRQARLEIEAFDLELPEQVDVGYVRGASDRVPGVLSSLGMPVTILTAEDLSLGDLDRFSVIAIGSRAYETDPELRKSNPRLLEYVHRGGNLVVQYQQYQFVEGGFAPYALDISRPHGRVTDEGAPVQLLDAGHRLFAWPNEIGSADWHGWIQERGLYYPGAWDERYRPLLAMRDEGRGEEKGALLVSSYGRGTYVYTGLSFFRQLPAGVPGAIRLFANLLAAGEAPKQREDAVR